MSFDMTQMPPPDHWDRFVRLIRHNAPRMPAVGNTRRERDLAAAGTTATMVSAAADGLGANVPGALGIATGLATSSSADQAASGLVDTGLSAGAAHVMGAEAGPLIGGFIMLVRGAYQSLDRGDQMLVYLMGISGFSTTLARATVSAMRDPTHYVNPPMPRIPQYIERMGDLYSPGRRRWFEDGYERVARVLRGMDEVRPTQGDHYSKRCLIHLGMQTNQTAQFAENNWRLRQRVEEIILARLLRIDLNRQREQLRLWANAP